MVVWSTGLTINPLISKALRVPVQLSRTGTTPGGKEFDSREWTLEKDDRTGAIVTDDRLRPVLYRQNADAPRERTVMEDLFALGDCASIEGLSSPKTAQVASQEAKWLAKRLNKSDMDGHSFAHKDLGIMAYIGNWNAIMQTGSREMRGRIAWLIWRGVYLIKGMSWRNRVLIPLYWSVELSDFYLPRSLLSNKG